MPVDHNLFAGGFLTGKEWKGHDVRMLSPKDVGPPGAAVDRLD